MSESVVEANSLHQERYNGYADAATGFAPRCATHKQHRSRHHNGYSQRSSCPPSNEVRHCKISNSTLVFSADGQYFSMYCFPNRRTTSAISNPGRITFDAYKACRADYVDEGVRTGLHANKSL